MLRGKGMPVLQGFGRGDQRVLVNVSVPRHLSDEQRRLLEEFDAASDEHTYQPRRELLREAEERVPLSSLRRVSIEVGHERAEQARATMIELFPEGFEEVDRMGGIELAAYTDAAGEERMWRVLRRWARRRRRGRVGGPLARVPPAGTGRPLWVGPPWETPPADALVVVVDPGRAFGTGSHRTTQLCLAALQELEPQSLLDVGCGSAFSRSRLRCSASAR